MMILFDTFIDHRLLQAPMHYKKVPLSEAHICMLVHNKKILINFCLCQGHSRVDKYFLNEKTGDVRRGCLDLDKLWSTSTKFYCQLCAGIVSSFELYKESYTGDKKEQKLWTHRFVILQLFHPLFRFYPGDDYDNVVFTDDNHNLFVRRISDSDLKPFFEMYGEWQHTQVLLVVVG